MIRPDFLRALVRHFDHHLRHRKGPRRASPGQAQLTVPAKGHLPLERAAEASLD